MRLRSLILWVFATSCLPGCSTEPSRPPTHPVSGLVTLKGRPLEGARVVFVAKESGGLPASGITDQDGLYHLTTFDAGDGAVAGTYGVKVAKYDGSSLQEPAEDVKEISYEDEQNLVFAVDEKPHPVARSVLPKKYDNEVTSGLTHTVTDHSTRFDIRID